MKVKVVRSTQKKNVSMLHAQQCNIPRSTSSRQATEIPSHGGPTDLHPGTHESTASTSYPPPRRPRPIRNTTHGSSRTTAHRQPPFAPINHRRLPRGTAEATVAFKYPDRRDRSADRPGLVRARVSTYVRPLPHACMRPSVRPSVDERERPCMLPRHQQTAPDLASSRAVHVHDCYTTTTTGTGSGRDLVVFVPIRSPLATPGLAVSRLVFHP